MLLNVGMVERTPDMDWKWTKFQELATERQARRPMAADSTPAASERWNFEQDLALQRRPERRDYFASRAVLDLAIAEQLAAMAWSETESVE